MINFLSAQQLDTVVYNPVTGNFDIRYTGIVTFAQDSAGNLRVLKSNDVATEEEEIVEKDSTITTVFEPGTKMNITLDCNLSTSSSEDTLEYSYKVKNGIDSKQKLGVLILGFGHGLQISGKTPKGWYGGQDYQQGGAKVADQWSWFPAGKNSKALAPGAILSGFSLECRSLPLIGNAYVQGQVRKIPWAAQFKDANFRNRLSRLWVFPANYICLRTIVPGVIPHGVEGRTLLDTLISYKHQALALKWIDNEGIANSLDQKLENAKEKLISRDSVAARNILTAFVNEVEAQKDKHLTSEVYALLKFNAEYLIDRLPQAGKKGK
jgi:hypothetical protein